MKFWSIYLYEIMAKTVADRLRIEGFDAIVIPSRDVYGTDGFAVWTTA